MEPGRNFIKELEEENLAKAKPKLYKNSSFKTGDAAPEEKVQSMIVEDDSDCSDDDNDEESKDVEMESADKINALPMPKSAFAQPPPKFTGKMRAPVAPVASVASVTPVIAGDIPKPKSRLTRCYDPIKWSEVFDEREMLDDAIPIYHSGTKGPLVFCIHGAGHSALSFGPLASYWKDFARFVSFDLRGHGGHYADDEANMNIDILLNDWMRVLKYVIDKYVDASIIIWGHSLGGALASKLAYSIFNPEESKEPDFDSKHIVALFIIDVAEGSALSALPFMEQIVESRPTSFDSIEEVIKWGVMSGQVRKLESARLTMPDQVVEQDGKFVWRTDLLASKDYWKEWFKGMDKCFLNWNVPKTLAVASNDRMDKELTIAQMMGKFKLVSFSDVGHVIQEDDPEDLARKMKDFIDTFKIKSKFNEKKVITNASGKQIIIDH